MLYVTSLIAIRLTSFPILLVIAWYERQAKQAGSSGFYNTMSAAAEKVYDTLPRQLKRLSTHRDIVFSFDLPIDFLLAFFEGLAGTDAEIDAVRLSWTWI